MYKYKKKEQANTKKYNITTKQEKDLCADPKCIHKKDKKMKEMRWKIERERHENG